VPTPKITSATDLIEARLNTYSFQTSAAAVPRLLSCEVWRLWVKLSLRPEQGEGVFWRFRIRQQRGLVVIR
jgi:hypothetical protein